MRRTAYIISFLLAGPAPASPAQAGVTCQRIPPGHAALVNYSHTDSPTGIAARYKLSRLTARDYLIELNIRFSNTIEAKGWRGYVSECLDRFSAVTAKKLPGVRIRLSEAPEVPVHEVSVGGENFRRSHAGAYEANAPCHTVVHEVLHLLGLPDEYLERDGERADGTPLSAPEVSCRLEGPVDSVMRSPKETFSVSSAPPDTNVLKFRVERCKCPPELDCTAFAQLSDGRTCPEGTTKENDVQYSTTGNEIVPVVTPAFFILTKGKHEPLSGDRTPASVNKELTVSGAGLWPAHLRALTEPGCEDVNRCFYACARNAYLPLKHSVFGGAKIDTYGPPSCHPVPADCVGQPYQCWN